MAKHYISWKELKQKVSELDQSKKYYGIPRGGAVIAGMTDKPVETPEEADIILDDILDSGATAKKWKEKYPNKEFIFLYNKQEEHKNMWLVFPYEEEGVKDIKDCIFRVMEYVGQNVPDVGKITVSKSGRGVLINVK